MHYLVGTSGFHYDHWRGLFYPAGLPRSRWLEFYARHFCTLELNNPFYRLPSEDAFRAWRDGTPEGFTFAVKASRFITHVKRLRGAADPVETFLGRARLLGSKLGPVLYQLPPQMKRDNVLLEEFLSLLPVDVLHVLEFRHASWYHDAVYALLDRYGAAFCVHDLRDVETPLVATGDLVYMRFHGTSGHYYGSYSDAQLQQWASRIRQLASVRRMAYAYFNNDAHAEAVRNADSLLHFLRP